MSVGKRRRKWVSRKSGNSKLQPDGPNLGAVVTQWSMKSDFGRRGGYSLGGAAQPEVCKDVRQRWPRCTMKRGGERKVRTVVP